MLKKCIGIISWLPAEQTIRKERKARLNKLIKQLNELWPTTDILIIAQNWDKTTLPKVSNNIIIKKYKPLGILKARQTLREEFLKLDYDYIITLDDDAIIECSTETAADDYMKAIDEHPNGFCFIHSRITNNTFDDYKAAQLNLCAISRYIYEKAPYVDVDPQNNEAFEDHVYSYYLHVKFEAHEFLPPDTITHTQFLNRKEPIPSTWSNEQNLSFSCLVTNTNAILSYIKENGDLPEDIHGFLLKYQKKRSEIRVNATILPAKAHSETVIKKSSPKIGVQVHEAHKSNYLYF